MASDEATASVWVVQRHYDYEGATLVSIWTTRDLAVKAAERDAKAVDYERVHEDSNEWRNCIGSATIVVEEWPVQS